MEGDSNSDDGASRSGPGAAGLGALWAIPEENSALLADLDRPAKRAFLSALDGPHSLETGQHVVRYGDPFSHLYLVQSGSLKAYADDANGREHVLGFYLPGELAGSDAIYSKSHRADITALERSSIYSLPYSALTELLTRYRGLSSAMLRIMAQYALRAGALSGSYRSEELLAGFLVMLSHRQVLNGRAPNSIVLSMSRRDIANYLRLAPETVSRIFTRFSHDGLIRQDHHVVTLLDREQLSWLAGYLREA